MSKASKARNQMRRKQKKLQAKAAKRALYLSQSKLGKRKEHQQKSTDKNRYGKIWEKAGRSPTLF